MSRDLDRQAPDELLEQLAQLPARDLDPARVARVRDQALSALEVSEPRGWEVGLGWLYCRVLEPTLVVAVSSAYLVWAFGTVRDLLLR